MFQWLNQTKETETYERVPDMLRSSWMEMDDGQKNVGFRELWDIVKG